MKFLTFGANDVTWFGGTNGVPKPDGCNKLAVYPGYVGTDPRPVR